jgi:hypothetical protein
LCEAHKCAQKCSLSTVVVNPIVNDKVVVVVVLLWLLCSKATQDKPSAHRAETQK